MRVYERLIVVCQGGVYHDTVVVARPRTVIDALEIRNTLYRDGTVWTVTMETKWSPAVASKVTELGPGIWAEVVDGVGQMHVDLQVFASHLGIPEAEAEKLIEGGMRSALETVYGPEAAAAIPIEVVEDRS